MQTILGNDTSLTKWKRFLIHYAIILVKLRDVIRFIRIRWFKSLSSDRFSGYICQSDVFIAVISIIVMRINCDTARDFKSYGM